MWRATIELIEGETIEIYSGYRIKVQISAKAQFLIVEGEWDTLGVPFAELKFFRVYEQGVLTL